jgi:hypothetical protein
MVVPYLSTWNPLFPRLLRKRRDKAAGITANRNRTAFVARGLQRTRNECDSKKKVGVGGTIDRFLC